MCGITGWVSFTEAPRRAVVEAMTETLTRRGPDAGGVDYDAGLQRPARESLDTPVVRAIVDETAIKTALDAPAGELPWGQRLRLERVVDLAPTLDEYQPDLAL